MSGNYSGVISEVKLSLDSLRDEVSSLTGSMKIIEGQNAENQLLVGKFKEDREVFKKAIELVLLAGNTVRDSIKTGFENIVTYALKSIVGEDYNFVINFTRRRNQQEVDFNVQSSDLTEPYNPMDSRGGGIVDIVSLALRISIIELRKPKVEGPIILDEPFKHLSKVYITNASEFLNGLVNRLGRQIICVTHRELTESDKVIEI